MTTTEVELNRETIQFIVEKAHEFHTRDDVSFDEEPGVGSADWSRRISDNYGGDPYYQELRNAINDLEPDQQVSLVALMWVGRGDFSADEWGDALAHAGDSWNEHTADYLIGTALLADYLDEGLAQLESDDDE
jgi:enoyl-CoA hydratase/carnithine racemase